MRMQAETFGVTLRIQAGEEVAIRYATFEEVEEVHDFLQTMVMVLNPNDEVEVTCEIKYEKMNREVGYLIEVEVMKCKAQYLELRLNDL